MRFMTRMLAKDPKKWTDADWITAFEVVAAIAGAMLLRARHKKKEAKGEPWLD